MTTFASELLQPPQPDWGDPLLDDVLTLQFDDGTTVTNCITGVTGEVFDAANQVGASTAYGERLSITWNSPPAQSVIDEITADPFSVLETEQTKLDNYGLKLTTASEQISIPFVGDYDIDVVDTDNVSTNYTGAGAFILDGTVEKFITEISGTDNNGFHLFSLNRTSGTVVQSETSALTATLVNFPDPATTSGFLPIIERFVFTEGDYADIVAFGNGRSSATSGIQEYQFSGTQELTEDFDHRLTTNFGDGYIIKGVGSKFKGDITDATVAKITRASGYVGWLFDDRTGKGTFENVIIDSRGGKTYLDGQFLGANFYQSALVIDSQSDPFALSSKIVVKDSLIDSLGGAIYSYGTVDLINSIVKGNTNHIYGTVRARGTTSRFDLINTLVVNAGTGDAIATFQAVAESLVGYNNFSSDASATTLGIGTGNVTPTFNPDGTIEQAWYDASLLKSGGWNNTDPVRWAVGGGGTTPPTAIDLVFADTIKQVTADSITISNISVLDLSGNTTQPTADSLLITNIEQLAFSDNTSQPSSSAITIANLNELSFSDNTTQVTGDSFSIDNITQLSMTSNVTQPLVDNIAIEQVGYLSFSDNARSPTVDTLAIELYTELEFTSTIRQVTADSIVLTTKTMPIFGNDDLLLVDTTVSYSLIDNTTDYSLTNNTIDYKAI